MFKINKIVSVFAFFGLMISISAQTRLSGFVYKQNSRIPLHETTVSILELGMQTKTDRAGYYLLEDVPMGIYTLRVNKLGYEMIEIKIELSVNKLKYQDLFLSASKGADVVKDLPLFSKYSSNQFKIIETQNPAQFFSKEIEDQIVVRELNQTVFNRKNRSLGDKSLYFWNHVPLENHNYLQFLQILAKNPQEVKSQQEIGKIRLGNTGGLVDVGATPLHQDKGLIFAYDNSQEIFNNRYQLAYNNGIAKNGWGYTLAGSFTYGNNLAAEKTQTAAKSIHGGLQKIWKKNSLDFTLTYLSVDFLPQEISTQEVYDLQSESYNPLWGFDSSGKTRSVGNLEMESSTVQSTYKKQIDFYKNIKINAYFTQDKNKQNSFLSFDAASPLPNSIRNLPSYLIFLGESSAMVENQSNLWMNDSGTYQINWQNLAENNSMNPNQSITNTNLSTQKSGIGFWYNDDSLLSGKFGFRLGLENSTKVNFSYLDDLLGASSFPSIQDPDDPNSYYNLEKPLDFVVGDKLFNYELHRQSASFTSSYQKKVNKLDYGLGFEFEFGGLQRIGKTRNSYFSENSLGKSDVKIYANTISKFSVAYNPSKLYSYSFASTFGSLRTKDELFFPVLEFSHLTLENLENQKTMAFEVQLKKKSIKNIFKITPFFDYSYDGTIGQTSIYDLELENANPTIKQSHDILTQVEKMNFGAEIFLENILSKRFTLTSLLSLSRNTYQNNPTLYSYSNQFSSLPNNLIKTKAELEGLFVGGTPQNWLHTNIKYQTFTNWSFVLGANFLFSNYSFPNFFRYSSEIYNGQNPEDFDQETLDSYRNQSKLANLVLVNFFLSKQHQTRWFKFNLNAGINNLFDNKNSVQEYQNSYARNIEYWQTALNQESNVFQNNSLKPLGRMFFTQLKFIY